MMLIPISFKHCVVFSISSLPPPNADATIEFGLFARLSCHGSESSLSLAGRSNRSLSRACNLSRGWNGLSQWRTSRKDCAAPSEKE